MPLTRVTITGADDNTDPVELIKLSEEFPFVEWGVLIGSVVNSRFPSVAWIRSFVNARSVRSGETSLSLHVCGHPLREIADGKSTLDKRLGAELYSFRRVQLNWHGERQGDIGEKILAAFCNLDIGGWDPTLIFQLDGVNDRLFEIPSRRFACVGLFDSSHGAGVVPGEWPKAMPEIGCGWAGGLGPDNLDDEIPKITEKALKAMDFWIDMETKVRTGGEFDLFAVRHCLEIAEPYVTR